MKKLVIDAGGSALKYALMTEEYEIIEKGKIINTFEGKDGFVRAVKELSDRYGTETDGIAISYCGELNTDTGEIHCPGSYTYLVSVNLKEILEKETGKTVWIEKDAACAALAEVHKGALQAYQDAVCLTLGSGLGCAVIIGQNIRHGMHDMAGLTMVQPVEGAFMRKVMTDKLIRAWNRIILRQKEPEGLNGYRFFEKVEAGNPFAIHRMRKFLGSVARFIQQMQCILDVEAFAIGGGVSAQPRLIEELQKEVDKIWRGAMMRATHVVKPEIVPCQYKNEANLIGALYFYERKERK